MGTRSTALSSTRPIDSLASPARTWREAAESSSCRASASSARDQLSREPGTLSLEVRRKMVKPRSMPRGINPLVLVAGADHLLEKHAETIRLLVRRHAPLVITCVDRESLAALRGGSSGILREIVPDIVVFDESFVNHAVPFGAFTARKSLFACWNRPGKATFHSTTFQPNTISTLHFMSCLARRIPTSTTVIVMFSSELLTDLSRRGDWFRRYYNPVALSAHSSDRILHGGCSRRWLVHRCQRPPHLRCRQRSRLQLSRPQSRRPTPTR